MPIIYHIRHPTNRSILSHASRESLATTLHEASSWPAGRYMIYILPPEGEETDTQQYYCGFLVKGKNANVEYDDGMKSN